MQLKGVIKSYVQKRLFGTGPTDDWSFVDQFTGPAKDIKLLRQYQGVAYRCIDIISRAHARKYKPFIYSQDVKGNKTTIYQHPFLSLLEHPDPEGNVSFSKLMEGSATFVELFGEFFWYMVPGKISGMPRQIILLRPDKVGIVLDKDTGEVIGYKLNIGSAGGSIPFTPDEIRHYMTFNPHNPYRGYSTVEAAIEYVMTEGEVSRFTRNYFKNNAAMSGIVSVNGKVPRDNWNKFVRQWRERYAGTDNAGKVALVRDSQIDFKPISSSIQDMQLDQLKQTTLDQVIMMFQVPKGMLGMAQGEGLGRSSIETLEYIFAKWTIDDKFGGIDDFLQGILDKYWPAKGATFSGLLTDHQNIIPADKEFELQVYNQGVDRWITRKEIRDKDPELANNDIDGSDQLFTTTTQLPISDPMTSDKAASKPAIVPNNGPASGGDDTEGDDNDDNDDGDGADGKAAKPDTIKIVSKKKVLKLTTSGSSNTEEREKFRLSQQAAINASVDDYKLEMAKVLKKQENLVLQNLSHLGRQMSAKGIVDTILNKGSENAAIKLAVMPVINKLADKNGNTAAHFAQNEADYAISQATLNALQQSTDRMASNFNDDTIDYLNDTLSEGITAGEGFDQLSKRVASVYEQAADYRTDRVARTETQNASNSATLDAYHQNPAVTSMQWYANPGACEFCSSLDGTQVGLDDTFVAQGDSVDVEQDDGSQHTYQADYGDVNTPPLHPNCECTIIPVTG